MRAIGGYFELELNKKEEYHTSAVKLNTGRNALEYILTAKKYKKLYLPFYTCDVILQPLQKLSINYEFYHINELFEPLFEISLIKDDEAFLYTNYFGLKDSFIREYKNICKNLIVDNAQAFFSDPCEDVDTFYSPRKFFGVPDGAYLYTNVKLSVSLEKDVSFQRFEHLLRRIDLGAEKGYSSYLDTEKLLDHQPIMEMSNLTYSILNSIDYEYVAKKRRDNFLYLHDNLGKLNQLKFELESDLVPMVYPFLPNKEGIRMILLKNRVYTAQYWAVLSQWVHSQCIEYKYSNELLHLPIDQRYSKGELNKIIDLVQSNA